MQVTVDRHSLPLLPTLDCSDITVEVGRDFLPGIQALFERLGRRRCGGSGFAHRVLLLPARSESGSGIVTRTITVIECSPMDKVCWHDELQQKRFQVSPRHRNGPEMARPSEKQGSLPVRCTDSLAGVNRVGALGTAASTAGFLWRSTRSKRLSDQYAFPVVVLASVTGFFD